MAVGPTRGLPFLTCSPFPYSTIDSTNVYTFTEYEHAAEGHIGKNSGSLFMHHTRRMIQPMYDWRTTCPCHKRQ